LANLLIYGFHSIGNAIFLILNPENIRISVGIFNIFFAEPIFFEE